MMGLWVMGVECGQDYQDQFVQVQGTDVLGKYVSY